MKAKVYNGWFRCAHCSKERDLGYEIEPRVTVCEKCYKKMKKTGGKDESKTKV